ncbi:MAG TPA: hypothetical protein VGI39_08005 [Polyangiaceae bacterium]
MTHRARSERVGPVGPASVRSAAEPWSRRRWGGFATIAIAASLAVAAACSSTTNPLPSDVVYCQTNADCRSTETCQFQNFRSCGQPGSCVPRAADGDGAACVPQNACGCDGQTRQVCLLNGNATSPIASLGTCDGASTQQPLSGDDGGVEAAVEAGMDAPSPRMEDASEASVVDSAPPPPVDSGADTSVPVDASDAGPPTLGTPCTSTSECTDPVFSTCHSFGPGMKYCTTTCLFNSDCQPPASAICDVNGYCEP